MFLVPRLPGYDSVPLLWWLYVAAPVVVLLLALVILRRADWAVVALSTGFGVAAALIVMDAQGGRHGLPTSKDVFFGTREYLWAATYRTVCLLAVFIFVSWLTVVAIHFATNRRSNA